MDAIELLSSPEAALPRTRDTDDFEGFLSKMFEG
jgi:hypothetical protein